MKFLIIFFKIFIVLCLLVAGITKLINPKPAVLLLKAISVFPTFLIIPTVSLLPIAEILLGLALAINYRIHLTLIVIFCLFFVFLLFSVYGFLTGLQGDCGCFGSLLKSEFNRVMIIRNFLFTIISGFLYVGCYKESKQI